MPFDVDLPALVLITLVAAMVNGALGHGFSSITVPVALLFYTNRLLNPALVLIEVVINCYILLTSRKSVPAVWRRVVPIFLGLAPGVIGGAYLLSQVNPEWLKFFVFLVLLPLILLQAAGFRRPIHSERAVGIPFGASVGVLYSLTTLSGPPLALMFNNQGFVKQEFRAALGLIRVAESTMTAVAYYFLGLYTWESARLLPAIAPSVLVGIPLGVAIIKRIEPETFRRICMSFDAWVVGFGLSRITIDLGLIGSPSAYGIWLAVVLIDAYLLLAFFSQRRAPTYASVVLKPFTRISLNEASSNAELEPVLSVIDSSLGRTATRQLD
ncbi:MAG TPA: sulfite exporter TauE/SafE family protein [Methylomirabilota bacterium]|nr:sulfite exporter TauE/SafE family protein [Methylomirabilota bacterium]